MALTSDIAGLFNEWSPAHYRLFNVRTVIAPAQGGAPLPPFLMPLQDAGRFRIFGTSASGYFDLVDAPFAVYTTRENFYDVNSRWLQGEWARNKQHLWLDFGEAPNELKRISAGDALPNPPDAPSPGEVRSEVQTGEADQADGEAIGPSFGLFNLTGHRS